jgi:hypothetical protein
MLMAVSASVMADDADKAREEMQRKLNESVMSSPFNAGDIKKAQAWAEDAKKQGVAPVPQAPSYWRPGWSCSNLTAYAYYNYMDYRNCVYHHYYYGRYWR